MLNTSEKSHWFQVNPNTPFYALLPNFCLQVNLLCPLILNPFTCYFLGLIQCIMSYKIVSINKGALLLKTGRFSSLPSTFKVKNQKEGKTFCTGNGSRHVKVQRDIYRVQIWRWGLIPLPFIISNTGSF